MRSAWYLLILLFWLVGCTPPESQSVPLRRCTDCHSMASDANHRQGCTNCHLGKDGAEDREAAHQGLIASPAQPDQVGRFCSPCHAEIVGLIATSSHFTLAKSTNLFRRAYGAEEDLATFRDTPQDSSPQTILGLADDLLRRRCFRCHPYSPGDGYPKVAHGTGCAACHLPFTDGKAQDHRLQPPGDEQCLSCHYGNYVGFDYYGRFEHDFHAEYRTPFTAEPNPARPWGLDFHQLQPDVHQVAGMSCIDCHSGRELMGLDRTRPACEGCHEAGQSGRSLPARVEQRGEQYLLQGHDGKERSIPQLRHPAHQRYRETVTCQACHAQWTFNDLTKHFLRSDTDDFEPWINLSAQGDLELETIIDRNNDFDQTEVPAEMTDKLTGKAEPGLWHKGFTIRRWETVRLGRDDRGRIAPLRPMLDYRLSWLDQEETVRFDAVPAVAPAGGWRPYVPHTTGPAGLFYRDRLELFLAGEHPAATAGDLSSPTQSTEE